MSISINTQGMSAVATIVALVLSMVAAFSARAASTEDLDERLKGVGPEHPRLFFTEAGEAELRAKIEEDPVLGAVFGFIRGSADKIHELEPLTRDQVGRRLLGVSRACLQRVSYLAFAYRMTGDEVYARRAEREMLAAAGFTDWNPSHFLDVAEMTAALAIGYDWTYHALTPEARETIRKAIVEKGLQVSMPGGWWVSTTNNWNQVCHGGLVMGALAVLEHEPDLAHDIIKRAIENLPRAMHEYEPDGVYPEGPSYWDYGTTYNVLLISALESVLGSDFGLASAPGFAKTPEFYLHATGPTGLYFNFSDCGARGGVAPAMHWFAERRDDPDLLWRERIELQSLAGQQPNAEGSGDRLLPFLLLWARGGRAPEPPRRLHWKGDGPTPVAMHRSGWGEDATYLGIKGGSPSVNHAHMDIGSFVLDMGGVRWAIDLGAQSYHSLESRGVGLWNRGQNSDRWTVFRLNNWSHNTLVVDSQLQRVDGHAPIIAFSHDPDAPFTVVDMLPVYEEQLARALRGARLIGDAVLIQDDLTALDRPTPIRWGMVTRAEVTIESDNAAVLRQDGKSVSLRVLSPAGARLAVFDTENPPRDFDAKNPGTRMIGFEVELAPGAAETLAVFIQPGESSGEPPAIAPVAAW